MLQVEVSVKGKMAKCADNINCLGQTNLRMQAGPSRTWQSYVNEQEHTKQNEFTNVKYRLLAMVGMVLTRDICC